MKTSKIKFKANRGQQKSFLKSSELSFSAPAPAPAPTPAPTPSRFWGWGCRSCGRAPCMKHTNPDRSTPQGVSSCFL